MSLDICLRSTLRNFSTLFLLIAVVIGPLHVVFAFWFRSVLALGDIDADRGIEVGALNASAATSMQWAALALVLLEIGLIPLLRRGAARVIERDLRGEVPTVWDALGGFGRSTHAVPTLRGGLATAGVGSIAAGLLLGSVLALVTQIPLDLLPDSLRFVGIAASQTATRAAALAFVITFFALIGAGAKATPGDEPTS